MNLKILHVVTTIELGGAEKQLLTLAKNQVSAGNTVSIHYLKGMPELLKEFQRFGISVIPPATNILRNIFRLANVLRQDFDIAHSHLPRAELALGIANIISNRKVTLVASRHNAEPFFPRGSKLLSSVISRFLLRLYDGVVFISQAVKSFVNNANELPAKMFNEVIYYGFDQSIKEGPGLATPDFPIYGRFLFVGRLTSQKNVAFLLSVFRKHLVDFPRSELHIYGTGELEGELRRLVKDLSSNVIWHSKSSSIDRIMQSSTCLILPSRYEGFGLVLLEAIQNSLPILASNTSAIPEVLGSNHPGLFNLNEENELLALLKSTYYPDFRPSFLKFQNQRLGFFDPELMVSKLNSFYFLCQQSKFSD